jgi:hypothetical protein
LLFGQMHKLQSRHMDIQTPLRSCPVASHPGYFLFHFCSAVWFHRV